MKREYIIPHHKQRQYAKKTNLMAFSFVALLLLLCQACSKNTVPKYEVAEMTLVLTLSADAIVFEMAYLCLQNNDTGNRFWGAWVYPNAVKFRNVLHGTYTLISEYEQVFAENIYVDTDSVVHNIFVDLENIDHRMITIQNSTGNPIQSVFVKRSTDLPFNNNDNMLKDILLNGEDYNFITLRFRNSIVDVKLIDTNENSYTKHTLSIVSNDIVIFTADDLDGGNIKHPYELYDRDRFDLHIHAHKPDKDTVHDVYIVANIVFSSIGLKINGDEIDIYPFSLNSFREFGGYYDFTPGKTYLFEITTTNPDINSVAYLTIAQDMIHVPPATISKEQVDLSWILYPDDHKNSDFLLFGLSTVGGYVNPNFTDYVEMLSTCNRNYNIPAGFILSPTTGRTSFNFVLWNYSISEQVSFLSFAEYQIHYFDGVFLDSRLKTTPNLLNIKNIENNLVGGFYEDM